MEIKVKEMKKLYPLFALLLLAAGCHKPEYVEPTAERQGITSLTAYYTFGPFIDQEMGKLTITDPNLEKYVIPVPFYYPVTSDDETSPYMTKARIRAELQPNCSLKPALSIIDLTQENIFEYTDAQGTTRNICITGERMKSSDCDLLAFSIVDPAISGIIDKANRTVALVSADDMPAAVAEYQLSPHATISPDPAVPHDYNSPMTFTVTANDGKTSKQYVVSKVKPEKTDYGFSLASVEAIFNFDPVSNFGAPPYTTPAYLSMGVLSRYLIISYGDGSAPIYLNKLNGTKIGNINIGSATVASIASDESDNLLISNHVDGGGTINLYKTSSVTEAPVLYHSFINPTTFPVGYNMKVIGDLDGAAQIVMTTEGIPDVSTSSKILSIVVSGGAVTAVNVVDASAAGLNWGAAPVGAPKIAPLGVDPAKGWMGSYYDANIVTWFKADGAAAATMPTSDGASWAWNPIFYDGKQFNNANYVAMLLVSHFPNWGVGPQLFLYDVTDPSQLTGEFTSSPAIVLSNTSMEWYQKGGYDGSATGDVIIAPTEDGYNLYIYYYDYISGVIGGYSANCLK